MSLPAPATLDYWRSFLNNSNHGIFETIENAILVAANDFLVEFVEKSNRKQIMSRLLLQCKLHIRLEKKDSSKVLSNSYSDCIVGWGRDHKGEKERNNKHGNERKKCADYSTGSKNLSGQVESDNFYDGVVRGEREKGKNVVNCNEGKKNAESSKGSKINVATGNSNNYADTCHWSKKNFGSRKYLIDKSIAFSGKTALAETSGGSMGDVMGTGKDVSVAKLAAEEVEVEGDAWRNERESDAAGEVIKIRDTLIRLKEQV